MPRHLSLSITLALTPFLFTACNASKPTATTTETPAADPENHSAETHAHPTEGPHHGLLIEFAGEAYHAELTHDDATNTVTIYLLDNAAKNPVTSPDKEVSLNLVIDGKPVQKKLAAKPETSDKAGESSRYTIEDENLIKALDAESTTGRLTVNLDGKEYSGKLPHSHKH